MTWSEAQLQALREKYGQADEAVIHDPAFRAVAARIFNDQGQRLAPYAGMPTLLDAPAYPIDWRQPDFGDLQVALLGIPMDLGVSNRAGSRFGPRALRAIERVGPYHHVLKVVPTRQLRVADLGDVPLSTRYSLAQCHADIEQAYRAVVAAGVIPVSVGGDHSVTLPVLKALGAKQPLGLVHIDAHCDTGGESEGSRFHHGGPFREAVLAGVLDPTRTIQIGIRGAAEYLWEFSYESGMTVVHAEDVQARGVEAVIAQARQVVGDQPFYVSFDVDGLDPAFAPGTGTPEIGGLTTREAMAILQGLAGLDIVGGDVVEVAPAYDATANTAHAGAQMLFEILSLICVRYAGG